jgi:hypothetical protein
VNTPVLDAADPRRVGSGRSSDRHVRADVALARVQLRAEQHRVAWGQEVLVFREYGTLARSARSANPRHLADKNGG